MTWLSVNPKIEKIETVEAAMAISGDIYYQGHWDSEGECFIEPPKANELTPREIAQLYNNADALGLDIYRIGVVQ